MGRAALTRRLSPTSSPLAAPGQVGWVEVHAENYLGGGPAVSGLLRVRQDLPVSLHGVGLSLGGTDPLDGRHLRRLAGLVERIEPVLVSEHLSWSTVGGDYLNALLPLPYTDESLDLVCERIDRMQSVLRRRVLIENPSAYLTFCDSCIPEVEFLAAIVARTGCGLLLDLNNLHVTATNCGLDAEVYLDALPGDAIGEVHLAGHRRVPVGSASALLIDDHGGRVSPAVWRLHADAIGRFGRVPTLVEWDRDLPALAVLLDEAKTADAIADMQTRGHHGAAA